MKTTNNNPEQAKEQVLECTDCKAEQPGFWKRWTGLDWKNMGLVKYDTPAISF